MPFTPGDKNINRSGRPKMIGESRTKETIAKDELEMILRRLKPLSRKALTKLGVMLDDDTTSETNTIKIAVYVLDKYKDYLEQVYMGDDSEEDGADLKPAEVTPLFSFKMVDK